MQRNLKVCQFKNSFRKYLKIYLCKTFPINWSHKRLLIHWGKTFESIIIVKISLSKLDRNFNLTFDMQAMMRFNECYEMSRKMRKITKFADRRIHCLTLCWYLLL